MRKFAALANQNPGNVRQTPQTTNHTLVGNQVFTADEAHDLALVVCNKTARPRFVKSDSTDGCQEIDPTGRIAKLNQ